jgi:hypothetical protein
VSLIGCTINDRSGQSVSYSRANTNFAMIGCEVVYTGGNESRLKNSAIFSNYDGGNLYFARNRVRFLNASAANNTERYIWRLGAVDGSSAIVSTVTGNVVEAQRFYAAGTQKWHVFQGATNSDARVSGNEVYGDGVTLCGSKTAATGLILTGNIFADCAVGVTVTNDDQYGTQAGCGANVFSSCGADVSGGTPVYAPLDSVLNYYQAGRRINDRSWRNAHRRPMDERLLQGCI